MHDALLFIQSNYIHQIFELVVSLKVFKHEINVLDGNQMSWISIKSTVFSESLAIIIPVLKKSLSSSPVVNFNSGSCRCLFEQWILSWISYIVLWIWFKRTDLFNGRLFSETVFVLKTILWKNSSPSIYFRWKSCR